VTGVGGAALPSSLPRKGARVTEALKKMADNALLTAFFKLVTAIGVPITIACMLTAAGFTKLVP
jgi:hypothetical protein